MNLNLNKSKSNIGFPVYYLVKPEDTNLLRYCELIHFFHSGVRLRNICKAVLRYVDIAIPSQPSLLQVFQLNLRNGCCVFDNQTKEAYVDMG